MITLGIDVSQATLALALWQHDHLVALSDVANNEVGWQHWQQQVATHLSAAEMAQLHVVLEPTGGYELPLALWAVAQGWTVLRPNPRQVRDWAKSQGRRAKTDAQDAITLALFGAQGHVPAWHPLPSEVGELEQLLHWRDDVQAQLQQARNRQQQQQRHPYRHRAVLDGLERLIQTLETELASAEQAIKEQVKRHEALQQAHDQLRTVPGVGERTAVVLLVHLWRWDVLTEGAGTSKGLTAFVGLDPQPYESGTSVHRHAGISRQGERSVRSRLYMGALGGIRGDNPLQVFYHRLVARGKAKKVALVAAARKLLTWAWAVFHSHTPFDAARYAA